MDDLAQAMALLREGRAGDAAVLLERGAGDPRIDPVLAFALQLADRHDDAAAAYARAIGHAAGQLAGMHVNRAQSLNQAGRLDEAAAAYEAAIALVPDHLAAYINLGTIRHHQRRLDEAERAFRGALAHDPDDARARTNLGAVLCALGRFTDAEAELSIVAAGDDEEAARAQAGLAAALIAQGRHVEALALARGAVARAPDLEDAHEQLANAALALDDHELGLAAAERACELDESMTTHEMRGAALASLQRMPEAAAAFRRAIELAPDDPSPWRNLARILDRLGEKEEAIASYRHALVLDPDGPAESLAGALVRRGQPGDVDEAIAILRRIVAADPDDASARHSLAALSGEQLETPPVGYVAGLFDDYAPRFEHHLVDQLGYQGHLQVRIALGDERGARGLDLGCGTGLCGAAIRDLVDDLTGVDLSAKMIELARKKAVYDRLEVADLVGFLRAAELPRYDVIVSADVLIYVGELTPLFGAVAARLAPGGRFAFTVEQGEGTWRLERHARYTHGAAYLDDLAARHRLAIIARTEQVVRQELGVPVPGLVYVLRAIG